MTTYTITTELLHELQAYLQTQCGLRCNAEYNPCEAQELDEKLQSLQPDTQEPIDFEGWQENPYTKVLMKSIKEDYVPKHNTQESFTYLANGMRFKTTLFTSGACITGMPTELAGRWVALVAADDDRHLKLTHPSPQKPLTDEQIAEIFATCHNGRMYPQDSVCGPRAMRVTEARAIEAAHGVKP